MKKILVLPVKNEEWILERTLAAASLWADHIIIADHDSTDKTLEIAKQFSKVIVIQNTHPFHTSTIRKELLDVARNFSGNNAIFSFDADEIPTAHMLHEEFWNKVYKLSPGTSIQFQWVHAWRSTNQYRIDGVHAPAFKHFGFVDDRQASYATLNVVNDHAPRIPASALPTTVQFTEPKVLHYQFADWDRALSKHAYNRMTEWIQKPHSLLTLAKINLKYFPSKDERGLLLAGIPMGWFSGYASAQLPQDQLSKFTWYDTAVLGLFANKGARYFRGLDIWDIDWDKKSGWIEARDTSVSSIGDPRNAAYKVFHKLLPAMHDLYKILT